MYRRGRKPDNNFQPDEPLYRRCQKDDLRGNRLLPTAIYYNDWSINRGKYSEPGDVLLPDWEDWGAVSFLVRDIPASLKSTGGPTYSFRVAHKPEDDNYAHSVVNSLKSGHIVKKLPRNVKKEFKQILSDRTSLIIKPKC